jgi:predicted MFS family arabinose efflux permease
MTFDRRRLAVAIAGFCAFINLYAPQALLPALAREFGVRAAEISLVMTAGTLAIALTAPFTGAIADVLGRKRVIAAATIAVSLPMMMVSFAADVQQIIFWRFLQGLALPPIFVVAVAYIGDEWPPAEVPGVAGLYTAGASLGGFSGRIVPGVLTDLIGWRAAFFVVAMLTLVCALVIALMLDRERHFVRSLGLGASARQMLKHLRNPQLLGFYAVGFGVLFNFIVSFTYVSFHLAAPPYRFSSTLLGAVFFTYLSGTATAPLIGRAVARFGARGFVLRLLAVWACGALLLLASSLYLIIAGLTLCAACGMLCQGVSTGAVTGTAKEGRSSAVGLYVTSFYIGGSVGAFLPGLTWETAGWPAAVAMVLVMLALMAAVVAWAWRAAAGAG